MVYKSITTFQRIWVAIISTPMHITRLILHLTYFIPGLSYRLPCKPANIWMATGEIGMYLMDILAIPTVYEILSDWTKWSTRPLTERELALTEAYFGDSINTMLVRVHPNAKYTAKKLAIAYVSFNTINHWHEISEDIFVHELMHVWQYQHLGSVYALKALYAQSKGNAYDYGGVENLYHSMLQGKELLDFNFEQQAQIIQDYCIGKELDMLNPLAESVYKNYVNQVMEFR